MSTTTPRPPEAGQPLPPASAQPAVEGLGQPMPPSLPPLAPQPAQQHRRRRWPLVLAIVGGVVVLAAIGIVAFALIALNNNPASAVTQQYYDAIKAQDYAKAYTYLDPNMTLTLDSQKQPMTQTLFVQVGQSFDQQLGKVTEYTITSASIETSTSGGATGTTTVKVTRNGHSYEVQLKLKQEGNIWVIVGFDNL